MKETLMYVVGALCEHPEAVKIGVNEDGNVLRFKLTLESDDRGRVIGREGRVIKSLRTILQAMAASQNKRVYLDIE